MLFPSLSNNEAISDFSNPPKRSGGLIVVGSFVPKSSQQLQHLLDNTKIQPIELNFQELFTSGNSTSPVISKQYIDQTAENIRSMLQDGLDVLLYTPRQLLNKSSHLQESALVSESICQIVQQITTSPQRSIHFLVAKGGITAHDLAERGLGITSAKVVGQILPGIPVWISESDNGGSISSSEDKMPYIVFPGNVGDEDSLTRVALELGVPTKPISRFTVQSSYDNSHNYRNASHDNYYGLNNPANHTQGNAGQEESQYDMKSSLQAARDGGYALAAFNICNKITTFNVNLFFIAIIIIQCR